MNAVANAVFILLFGAVAFLAVARVLNHVAETTLVRLANVAFVRVRPVFLARTGWLLQKVCASPFAAPHGLALRASAAADSGRTAAALAHVDEMLRLTVRIAPHACPWSLVNTATDIYINSGNYRKACAAADSWPPEAQARGREEEPIMHAFTLINRAEALYNLGENETALQLLQTVEGQSDLPPLARHGLLLLRSWILTHLDRTAEAFSQLSSVDPESLGPRYRAEYFFTRAVVFCGVGDLVAAEAASADGIRHAKCASSRRNALQIAARIAAAQGNHERSIDLLEAARTHAYQGQAASGLVLLGRSYEVMGQLDRARLSYSDAIVADPESFMCAIAKERMDALASVAGS